METFTPWPALLGGALIGAAASLLLLAVGRTAGVSGMIGGLLLRTRGDAAPRAYFIAGLFLAGIVGAVLMPSSIGNSPRGLITLAAAGLLVGIGTRLGGGCTSGHGVCGLSRLSPRSLVATVTFIAVAMVSVAAARALGAML